MLSCSSDCMADVVSAQADDGDELAGLSQRAVDHFAFRGFAGLGGGAGLGLIGQSGGRERFEDSAGRNRQGGGKGGFEEIAALHSGLLCLGAKFEMM